MIKTISATAIVLAALTTTVFAADFQLKDSNSQGSNVGFASSSGTGNGGPVGGNGTVFGDPLSSTPGDWNADQTYAPGSRGDIVQTMQAAEGRGRDK